MRDVPGNALACRRATRFPPRVGTMAADHNDGDRERLDLHSENWLTAGHPPDPLILPKTSPPRIGRTARTSHRKALRICLSRVPRRVARTVLRGDRRSNATVLPDFQRRRSSVVTRHWKHHEIDRPRSSRLQAVKRQGAVGTARASEPYFHCSPYCFPNRSPGRP